MREVQIGASVALEVRLTEMPGGALTGEFLTVAIRRKSDGFYLDFDDDVFKASGWVARTQDLVEQTGNEKEGTYLLTWNSAAAVTAHGEYAADFTWGADDADYFSSEDLKFTKLDLAVKSIVNRQDINEADALLETYEDDGATLAASWPLTDKAGADPVLEGTGPANRGAQS